MAEEKVYDTDKILKIIADLPLSWYEERYPDTASLQHWGTNVTINGEAINGFYIDLSLSEAQIVTGGLWKIFGSNRKGNHYTAPAEWLPHRMVQWQMRLGNVGLRLRPNRKRIR